MAAAITYLTCTVIRVSHKLDFSKNKLYIKESQINQAEAERQTQILKAQGDADARILQATAEAEAIRKVAEAIAATKTDPATYMLVNRYIDTLKEMAMGNDSKLVYLPYESSNLMSALGALTDLTKK